MPRPSKSSPTTTTNTSQSSKKEPSTKPLPAGRASNKKQSPIASAPSLRPNPAQLKVLQQFFERRGTKQSTTKRGHPSFSALINSFSASKQPPTFPSALSKVVTQLSGSSPAPSQTAAPAPRRGPERTTKGPLQQASS